jgi:hypothetical protein
MWKPHSILRSARVPTGQASRSLRARNIRATASDIVARVSQVLRCSAAIEALTTQRTRREMRPRPSLPRLRRVRCGDMRGAGCKKQRSDDDPDRPRGVAASTRRRAGSADGDGPAGGRRVVCVTGRRAAVTSRRPAPCARTPPSANSFSASWLAWAPQPRAASHGLAPHRAAARAAACSAAWEGARGDCDVAGTRRVAPATSQPLTG